jgi:xanthosine utilization system XapX-like protein
MPAFSNEKLFDEEVLKSYGDSEKYYMLHEKYQTGKFKKEDLGRTMVIGGGILILFALIDVRKLKSPPRLWILTVVGIFASCLTVVGFILGFMDDFDRMYSPPWADSPFFVLVGLVGVLFICILWVAFNISNTRKKYLPSRRLISIEKDKIRYWMAGILMISIVLFIYNVITNNPYDLIPGLIWIYFYASILHIKFTKRSKPAMDELHTVDNYKM